MKKKTPAKAESLPDVKLRLGAVTLFLLLTSCGQGLQVGETTTIVGTTVPNVFTAQPANGTSLPFTTPEPSTPIPTLPSSASPTELKYKVLEQFPDLFYCDPDFYPVARADELVLALERFPELEANTEEIQAILAHKGLSGLATFSDEQKLLIYREHKRLAAIHFELTGDEYQFQLQVAKTEGEGSLVTGTITGNGKITILERQQSIATCPICLAGHTQIDTPQGPKAVEDLHVGDAIWTADATGARIPATILKNTRVVVSAGHLMMHVVLDDRRELLASPGHPTTDGRSLSELRVGDVLDGGRILRLEWLPYDQPATYDVLPSGGTGWYWANGILMGSTLSATR
jgi:hypothetical protein